MAGKETKEKPLDKLTVKELREIAKEIPEITGVHGMNKAELLDAVKKAKGTVEAPKEEVEAPKEEAVETPQESAETPKEKAEVSKEKAEVSKEKAETPKEKVEVPKEEAVEIPQESAETPKEKAGIPKEKAEVSKKKVETPKSKKGKIVKDIKNKIRALKADRKAALEAKDKKMAKIYRRRISRLKKKTRRAA